MRPCGEYQRLNPISLISQRDQRNDAGGAASRQITRSESSDVRVESDGTDPTNSRDQKGYGQTGRTGHRQANTRINLRAA